MAAESNVMFESLMWLDLTKRILQNHNASNDDLGPFDNELDIEAVQSMMPTGSPQLDDESKWSMAMNAQEVQWIEHHLEKSVAQEPKENGPIAVKEEKQPFEPFEVGPPGSLHQARQLWNSLRRGKHHDSMNQRTEK